eukprot:Nitzschia sp. Nitz4//scaffold219_size35776//228//2123//NITZ4_007817-RA/size35776-processed-gene-0.0-mRNA-1//1//CDS//3329542299//3225//frame0
MTANVANGSNASIGHKTTESGGRSAMETTGGAVKFWRPLPFLAVPRQDAACTTIELSEDSWGIVLVGGRNSQSSALDCVELLEWNVHRRWWPLPSLTVARCGPAVVSVPQDSNGTAPTAALKRSLYVVGGINKESKPQKTMETLTLGTGSKQWTKVEANMSTARMYPAAVSFPSPDNTEQNIMVLGGRDTKWRELDTCEVYSIQQQSWTPRTPMSTSRFGCGAVYIASKRKVLVFGGYGGSSWLDTCEMYDVDQDVWTELPPMRRPLQFVSATLVAGDDAYVIVRGLDEERSAASSTLQCYNVETQEWIILPVSGTTIGAGLASVDANRIMLLGGAAGEFHEATATCQFWVGDLEHLFRVLTAAMEVAQSTGGSGGSLPAQTAANSSRGVQDMIDASETAAEEDETTIHPFLYPPTTIMASNETVASSITGAKSKPKVENYVTTDQFGAQVSFTGFLSEQSGKPHGKGRMIFTATGDQYEGKFEHGVRQGRGLMRFSNGDVFVGFYQNDQREGRGTYQYRDGRSYEGLYYRDRPEDEAGIMTWKDGTVYIGDFFKAKRTGKGKITFPNGVEYEGDFVSGKYQGTGECRFEDGSVYTGQWRHGKAHGQGKLTNADGKVVHDGKWVNDSPAYA